MESRQEARIRELMLSPRESKQVSALLDLLPKRTFDVPHHLRRYLRKLELAGVIKSTWRSESEEDFFIWTKVE